MINIPDDKAGRNPSSHAGSPGKSSPAKESYWRTFPILEKVLEQERPPVLDRLRATCRQLEAIVHSGSQQERVRAQSAITAFRRALELHQDLVSRRDEMLPHARNYGSATHDK
jgi:hypothetical protein